jgi:hypothetical protein
VLANASLGGNVTRIARVHTKAQLVTSYVNNRSVPPPPIDHCKNWSYSTTGMVQPSPFCPVVSIQVPEQSKVPVLSMTGILQPVPKPESQPELEEFLCCRTVLMYGRVYERMIELQRRRKIANFRPWNSEFSLQVRTDSNFLEISNVTFSEWEEINKHDKKIREKIREIHRLTTKEILPIRLLSALYSLATQLLQQCKRFVAEVQLVVDKAFNYVSLLFLGPVLAVLCCLVKCEDDRSSLCWWLKLVSKFHPIFGICVDVCDKIADSSKPTQSPQRRVRFSDENMESPTPTQPLSSAPDGGLTTETQQEKIARLLAMCNELLARH